MDDFREWLSDNLRYILLGLAIILILVIAFFAVRFISSNLGDDGDITTEAATESMVPTETQTEEITEAAEPLQTENQAILETVTKYYNAVASKNIEEIQSICDSLDEKSEQTILATPIESYNNISIYYKQGLTENSYIVYPYYEAKISNIDQLVPSLGNIYLDTREDGSLYVVNPKNNEEVSAFMEASESAQDVQKLIARIESEYNSVVESNPELGEIIQKYREPETEIDIPNANDVNVDISTTVEVTGNLNVREDSRQDSEQIGYLAPGQVVTRIEVLDNGWSKIRFDDGAGTVLEGYVLSEYLQETSGNSTSDSE